jgi:putative peptidoglycan lipid II flippase
VDAAPSPKPAARRSAAALAVGAGMLLSRIAGLVREIAFAHFLGNSDAAGAFKAALRIPNLLQNLFGEGALSASFIPVYARLLAEGKEEEAGRVAGAVASLLALAMALLVAVGTLAARAIIGVVAPGFEGDVRELTIRLVQIMFSGVGLLVLSAWCLGVLNSHRRFFLSYVAPVLWNVAIVAALLGFGGRRALTRVAQMDLTVVLAWATVAGAALQLGVQLPTALRLVGRFRPSLRVAGTPVREVIANFGPALVSRGVVQISAYVDQILSSYLGAPIVSAMSFAQILYTLPVSLFGMAVSAAELPEMSSALGSQAEIAAALRGRLEAALARIAFYVVPSVVAFLLLGDVVVATIFQHGHFGVGDTRLVWLILAGSTVGLLAATQARLLAAAFWALRDTRTPLAYACARVVATGVLGYLFALPLRQAFDWPAGWGAAGLTASAGLAGWMEFLLLRRALVARIGPLSVGGRVIARCWAAALGAGALGFALRRLLPFSEPRLVGVIVLGVYGALYLGGALALGVGEATQALGRVRRLARRR